MDKFFIIKVIISFFTGSIWITGSTVIAEKYGTKMGGLVAGLPSTLMFGLFFIAWTQNTKAAVDATDIVPLMGGINSIFLVVYMFLSRFNFLIALSGALFIWTILALLIVVLKISNFIISVVAYIVLFSISYYIAEKKLHIRSEQARPVKPKFLSLIFRGVLCGLVIAITVILAKISGPLIGGMFTMFPAMFLGTILITYFSHGPSFSTAVMKSSMISSVNVVVYGVTARLVFEALGLWIGTIFSLSVSSIGALITYRYIIKTIN